MTAISPAILIKAMDGLSLRAQVTAENIANANSPGYRPLAVSFEDALRKAASEGVDSVARVTPRIVPAFDSAGRPELRLDLELATASATAGRYAALAELLSRHLQLQALAVSGTR
jgi:flagellar basal-body rod protein FlgB